jgi:hypothetical protein
MKNIKTVIFSTAFFLSTTGCFEKENHMQNTVKSNFNDNGQLLDSISKVFKNEKITLDKWEATDVTDSTFSISIINAKLIPSSSNVDSSLAFYKGLAKSIKKVVKSGKKYNSYQIVFVVTDTVYGQVNQIHKTGMTVSNKEIL